MSTDVDVTKQAIENIVPILSGASPVGFGALWLFFNKFIKGPQDDLRREHNELKDSLKDIEKKVDDGDDFKLPVLHSIEELESKMSQVINNMNKALLDTERLTMKLDFSDERSNEVKSKLEDALDGIHKLQSQFMSVLELYVKK